MSIEHSSRNVKRFANLEIGSPKQIKWAERIRNGLLLWIDQNRTDNQEQLSHLRSLLYDIVDSRWYIGAERQDWSLAQMLGPKRPNAAQLTLDRAIQECVEGHSVHYIDGENNEHWDEIRTIIERLCRDELEKGRVQ